MIMTSATPQPRTTSQNDLPRHLKGNLCRCTGYHAIEDAIHGVQTVEQDAPGAACGHGRRRARRPAVVTGKARYTHRHRDGRHAPPEAVRSPHAHARVVSIDKSAALAVPGVLAVYTWEDVPRKLFTTAIHDDFRVDPNDTYILDNVVRFVGQRVVAVVADSDAAAEEGCRQVEIEYEVLPAVFDPEEAMRAGAPLCTSKARIAFIRQPEHNILIDVHGNLGDVEAGFAEADVIHEGTYSTHRGAACPPGDARLDRLGRRERPAERPHQLAIALHLPRQALLPLRPRPAECARLLRARGRRLRRQAGSADRGPRAPWPLSKPAGRCSGSSPARSSSSAAPTVTR